MMLKGFNYPLLSDLAPVRHGKGIRVSMAYVVDDLKTLKNLEK